MWPGDENYPGVPDELGEIEPSKGTREAVGSCNGPTSVPWLPQLSGARFDLGYQGRSGQLSPQIVV
jgi:hypothetical protein